MSLNLTILIIEAMAVYFLVLVAHSFRNKFGLYHFYALIGGITAIMSWVTDAGVRVDAFGISFLVGSTVFYTSLLLAVFIIYVFDGPRATRIAISTIIVVSVFVPVISIILNTQINLSDYPALAKIPIPSLRINSASVLTTSFDLIFLAIAWEFFGNNKFKMKLWIRSYLTLLGVMMIDVVLFNAGAFAGQPGFFNILEGTLISRFIISLFAFPFLLVYIYWQNKKHHIESEARPVFSILKQVAEISNELKLAKAEIEKQKQVENAIRDSLEKHRDLYENLGKENRLKELLLDVITHDLKNPAGAIQGLAEILRAEYPENEIIETVDKSVNNLMSVIENATSLAMIIGGEDIEKMNLDLNDLIGRSVNDFKSLLRESKIELEINLPELLPVSANPIIREIFSNFISNAVKYASEGGKLIISAKEVNDEIIVEFADFGNQDLSLEKENIFFRKVQLNRDNYSGRGLGLSIAKRIADAHNAEIGVKPNIPAGNIFYLRIKSAAEKFQEI